MPRRKNALSTADKHILKLLGYERTVEDGAQFVHPEIPFHGDKFPKYVWYGDTITDVLKNFTAGIKVGTMEYIQGSLQRECSQITYEAHRR